MTIEQRVAKLERQNRWMKRVGGLVLLTNPGRWRDKPI